MSSIVGGANIIPNSSIDGADTVKSFEVKSPIDGADTVKSDDTSDADATVKSNTDTPLVPNMSKYFKTPIEVLGKLSELNPKQFGKIVVGTGKKHFFDFAALGFSLIPVIGSYGNTLINGKEIATEISNEFKEELDDIVPSSPSIEEPTVAPVGKIGMPEWQQSNTAAAAAGGSSKKSLIKTGKSNTKKSNAIIRRIHNSRKIFHNTNKCYNSNKGNKNKTYKGKKHMKTKRRYK